MIEIEIDGLTELRSDLRKFPDKFTGKVIDRLAVIAFNSAFRSAGRYVKTGALVKSLDNRPISGGRQIVHDRGLAPHAAFIQFGTRSHFVAPRRKRALRWVTPSGEFAFSKGHTVRGIRADPYMQKAKNDAFAQFNNILDNALRESI